jgi:hypothetical protein
MEKVEKYYLFANTNQNFLKNKLNVNADLDGIILTTTFNEKNKFGAMDYISYWELLPTFLYESFNKNINLSAWVELPIRITEIHTPTIPMFSIIFRPPKYSRKLRWS